MNSKLILGIILGVGFLFGIVTTVSYVDAQESLLDDSDDMIQYKAPLRQIRDDGVSPKDVKCNIGKVLFFKISNKSPVCIYETSIEKLNSKDNKFMFWSLKNQLVDWNHLKEKISELEFNGITKVSLAEPYDSSISELPKIKFIQELLADKNKTVIFYDPVPSPIRAWDIEPRTKSNVNLYDPRSISYWPPPRDIGFGFEFQCNDGQNRYSGGGNPMIFSFSMIEKLFLIEHSQTPYKSYVSKLNDTYYYEYGSLFPTNFEFTEPLSVKTIKETQCTTNDGVFTNAYEIFYFYIVEFEINP
ncbi:MAG: hypothetical protein IIC67_00930 [Thaumarchaeota archaeon]|nr:hypothetical protein [Nitrososphaerota archaeon]